MKSTIASLRSLTLPFGATTGGRIVLDGVTGKIKIYNANGILLVEISPDVYEPFVSRYAGMAIYDVNGYLRAVFGSRDPAAYVALALYSAASDETAGGLISVEDWGTFNRMVISPGSQNNKGNLEWTLKAAAADNSSPAMLQAVGTTLAVGTPQPIIDFCGGSIPVGVSYPKVIVNDICHGVDAGYNNIPTINGSYPRGELTCKTLTSDSGTTSGGTKMTILTANAVTLAANRRIKCSALIRSFECTNAGDVFTFAIEDNGQRIGECNFRAQTAITGSNGLAFSTTQDENYRQPAAGSHTYTLTTERVIGSGTMKVNGADTRPIQLLVEDVGGNA